MEIISILKEPLSVNEENLFLIQEEIKKYPYCQPLYMVQLRSLKNDSQERFQEALQQASIRCSDREILFNYVQHQGIIKEDESSKEDDTIKETNFIEPEEETTTIEKSSKEEITSTPQLEEEKEELPKEKTIPSTPKVHSFSQWLHVAHKDKNEKSENNFTESITKEEVEDKFKIINEFLEKNPKITPVKDFKPSTVKVSQDEGMSHLMTETLANIYVEQKKYDKAIQAYRILRLKYPEKSGYFADQIKWIEQLKNN